MLFFNTSGGLSLHSPRWRAHPAQEADQRTEATDTVVANSASICGECTRSATPSQPAPHLAECHDLALDLDQLSLSLSLDLTRLPMDLLLLIFE